ncbi:MAG: hypothetical protein FJ044_04885, partial [Candidatus Cloacimonetes bacterium]|nr:hypothetical protein [Candidatus Cloacimonadota bacterium]
MKFKEKLLQFFRKFTLPTFIGSLVFLFVIVSLIALIWQKPAVQREAKISVGDLSTDLFPESVALTGNYPSAPEVSFDEYELNTSYPVLPIVTNIYTLKTNYPQEEIIDLGKKLGFLNLNQKEVSPTTIVVYDNQAQESRGILTFDRQTGAF